jgi:hypothetical protein
MKSHRIIAACLFVLVALAGCASTKITGSQHYQGERIARPARIIVHDFAATPADIPAWSSAALRYGSEPGTPQTSKEIETGRELGSRVATELVAEIQDMGLTAVRAAGEPGPHVGDIVIIGYFESIDAGSRMKRMVIGFGSGKAKLRTQVEGYVQTDRGLRKLGSREINSGGNKSPGLVVPIAVTIATANPIGLIATSALKVGGEVTGVSTIKGSAKRTAKEIAEELSLAFQEQGWL